MECHLHFLLLSRKWLNCVFCFITFECHRIRTFHVTKKNVLFSQNEARKPPFSLLLLKESYLQRKWLIWREAVPESSGRRTVKATRVFCCFPSLTRSLIYEQAQKLTSQPGQFFVTTRCRLAIIVYVDDNLWSFFFALHHDIMTLYMYIFFKLRRSLCFLHGAHRYHIHKEASVCRCWKLNDVIAITRFLVRNLTPRSHSRISFLQYAPPVSDVTSASACWACARLMSDDVTGMLTPGCCRACVVIERKDGASRSELWQVVSKWISRSWRHCKPATST